MNEQLTAYLKRRFPDADEIIVEEFMPIPGGFSRETYRFDAKVRRGGALEHHQLILRKDPPAASAILQSNRQVEHDLLEAVREHTSLPISRSYGAEMDPSVFGECAMIIERMPGSGMTSNLFHEGPDTHQTEEVVSHLCELIAALHLADVSKLNPGGVLDDPRGVGIDTSSWDAYMESTFDYYIRSFDDFAFDPNLAGYLDGFLTLRREKPRPLRLSLVHGDFNPANFLYEEGKVTALIDWENARIGDPREDLGWMTSMDIMSNTQVMHYPKKKGGFLNYYNELTGFGVTPEEVNYFNLFGTANIVVPVASALKRRFDREHLELLHLYIMQPSIVNVLNFARMLNYPLPEGV